MGWERKILTPPHPTSASWGRKATHNQDCSFTDEKHCPSYKDSSQKLPTAGVDWVNLLTVSVWQRACVLSYMPAGPYWLSALSAMNVSNKNILVSSRNASGFWSHIVLCLHYCTFVSRTMYKADKSVNLGTQECLFLSFCHHLTHTHTHTHPRTQAPTRTHTPLLHLTSSWSALIKRNL